MKKTTRIKTVQAPRQMTVDLSPQTDGVRQTFALPFTVPRQASHFLIFNTATYRNDATHTFYTLAADGRSITTYFNSAPARGSNRNLQFIVTDFGMGDFDDVDKDYVDRAIQELDNRKQDKLTAGAGIDITVDTTTGNTVISALGASGGVLENDLTSLIDLGGIKSGETFTAGTPIEDVLRKLLTPIFYPTLVAPTATLTGTGDKLQETGASFEATFTINFNRGSITPAYGTNGYRSGEATGYSLNGGATQTENTFTMTVDGSNNTFSGAVAHESGEQPKDSEGNDYDTPYPAGNVSTPSVSYEFVDALYATTVSPDNVEKQPLVSKTKKEVIFNLCAQTVAEPAKFDIPASWNVTAVQGYNRLTSQWENINDFDVSDETHQDLAGNNVAYKRYTDNRGYAADGRQIKVKWS